MAPWIHLRLARWLSALLVAFWPAAAAQACCCTGGSKVAGACPPGCCASEVEVCCRSSAAADDCGACFVGSQHDPCGCGPACGHAEPRAKLAPADEKAGSAPPPAIAATGTTLAATTAELAALDSGSRLPARPKRILYGVWRN